MCVINSFTSARVSKLFSKKFYNSYIPTSSCQFVRCFYTSNQIMEKVTDISIEKLVSSRFLKPLRMNYCQDGVKKIWDMGMSHASVTVIIFNKNKKKLLLVKQLRPAVLFAELKDKYSGQSDDLDAINEFLKGQKDDIGSLGITLELCAGIVDKEGKSLAEIAAEEVEEECGYHVDLKQVEFVQTFRGAIGTGGSKMSLFYVEVTDDQKVSEGGGVVEDGEMVEVVEMSIEEVKAYLQKEEVNCPTFTLYGLQWFLSNKSHLHI